MKTYDCQQTGETQRDRREHNRGPQSHEKVEHLFNGFHNLIATAELGGDDYSAGYLRAMMNAFAELVRSITPDEKLPLHVMPDTCDGKEQDAFVKWAAENRFDMSAHPLHFLFLSERTNGARQGWKAAISYCRDQLGMGELNPEPPKPNPDPRGST